MTMLAETVDVVIGVDTHKHTHTAAVVVAATGAAVDELTIDTDPDGYAALVAMADGHSGLRAWSIEGIGGYGAGLCRYLAERGEIVIELDRPNRPARRNGAKSDPLAMYKCDVCTIPSNLGGDPAMSVPFGTGDHGLPVGVQVLAPPAGEQMMFRVAAAIERANTNGQGGDDR